MTTHDGRIFFRGLRGFVERGGTGQRRKKGTQCGY